MAHRPVDGVVKSLHARIPDFVAPAKHLPIGSLIHVFACVAPAVDIRVDCIAIDLLQLFG